LERICLKVSSGKGMAKPTGFVSDQASAKKKNTEKKEIQK
jgi:hypothetical protein